MLSSAAILILAVLGTLTLAGGALSLLAMSLALARRMGWAKAGRRAWPERRVVLIPVLCALALGLGGGAWGFGVEPHWVEVTRRELPAPGPVCGKSRLRIVHLSDLHIEGIGPRERAAAEAVQRERPDLVLLTGDYLNRRESGAHLVEFLQAVKAPLGVVGVAGHVDGKDPVAALFDAAGAKLLRDDYLRIDGDGGTPLLLLGLDIHPHRTASELLEGAADGSYRILLHHDPAQVDQLRDADVHLFLSGHRHGGHAIGGGLRGWTLVPPPAAKHEGGTHVFVSRGLGLAGGARPGFRFLCRPEVAVIDLVAGP